MINDLVDSEIKKEPNLGYTKPMCVFALNKDELEYAAKRQKENNLEWMSKEHLELMRKKEKELKRQTGLFYNLGQFFYVAFNSK